MSGIIHRASVRRGYEQGFVPACGLSGTVSSDAAEVTCPACPRVEIHAVRSELPGGLFVDVTQGVCGAFGSYVLVPGEGALRSMVSCGRCEEVLSRDGGTVIEQKRPRPRSSEEHDARAAVDAEKARALSSVAEAVALALREVHGLDQGAPPDFRARKRVCIAALERAKALLSGTSPVGRIQNFDGVEEARSINGS